MLNNKMAEKPNPSLNDLRKRLTDSQQLILNEIWRYWREDRKIITAVALYNKFGKDLVESSLGLLGGSIVYRTGSNAGRKYYQLTFLGILLTESGKEGQELLEKYLGYIHSRLVSEPELTHVTREECRRDLRFTDEQLLFLTEILQSSPFWQGGNQTMGTLYLPSAVDDLALADDIHSFFEEHLFKNYDSEMPLDLNLQHERGSFEQEEVRGVRQLALTKPKLWVLGLGVYVLYLLYVVSSVAGSKGGLYAFQYRWVWWMALGQTFWFLIAVLAALLLASVVGPERFFGLFPFAQTLSLLRPIDTTFAKTPTLNESEIDVDNSRGGFSEQTGLGFQLYLDYNESIKSVYNNAILQYRNSFYFSLIFATVGFGVIFYTLVFRNNGNTSWAGVVVSAVIEAVPALFFYLSDRARKQMIDVFVDLRKDNEIARAYELLRTLKNTDRLEALKEEIIRHTLLTAPHREIGANQLTKH
jgi:hypothetical protein